MTYAKIIHHCFLTGKQLLMGFLYRAKQFQVISIFGLSYTGKTFQRVLSSKASIMKSLCDSPYSRRSPSAPYKVSKCVTQLLPSHFSWISNCTTSHLASSDLALLHSDLWQNSRNKFSCLTLAASCQPRLIDAKFLWIYLVLTLPSLLLCSFKSDGFPLWTFDVFVLPTLVWEKNKTKLSLGYSSLMICPAAKCLTVPKGSACEEGTIQLLIEIFFNSDLNSDLTCCFISDIS